jgi:stage V sporulation protein SpoVS
MLENFAYSDRFNVKVGATSPTTTIAGMIACLLRQQRPARVEVIEPCAINRAIRAIAIAHRDLLLDGIHIAFVQSFSIDTSEREKSGLWFLVEVMEEAPQELWLT